MMQPEDDSWIDVADRLPPVHELDPDADNHPDEWLVEVFLYDVIWEGFLCRWIGDDRGPIWIVEGFVSDRPPLRWRPRPEPPEGRS